MILNILYCLFFGILDFSIYLYLVRNDRIPKNILVVALSTIILIVFLHAGWIEISGLMKWNDFFGLLMFSIGIIILYFESKFQDSYIDSRKESLNQKLYERFKPVFDFVRYKLIYIMIYVYQFLAVWNDSYR
ncbi:hypothetical protein DYBT9275_02858 [Dyadobacter sp. CECT 9275]|uniref:Uncharacterized protein n=1 Tax=Dyadobacter helix TaxID=2822344 RepID=A0A916NC45_9BACT|nr:hypothetical protein DYBT9275_02858 [Dyadobacter sp. CECT 9275]